MASRKKSGELNIDRNATCEMQLKRRYSLIFTESLGTRNIGTAYLSKNSSRGDNVNFSVNWTTKVSGDQYYLLTRTASDLVFKVGNGKLTW